MYNNRVVSKWVGAFLPLAQHHQDRTDYKIHRHTDTITYIHKQAKAVVN